jgi:hypothetical protein
MANLVPSLRAISACGPSVAWVKNVTADPQAAWNAIPRGDWCLTICWMLRVDNALVIQAAVDCGRLALPSIPEPARGERALDLDAAELIQNPTLDDVKRTIELVGACACGGDVGLHAVVARAGREPPAALLQQMADAVRARIPYATVAARFVNDGQGNLSPLEPVPT